MDVLLVDRSPASRMRLARLLADLPDARVVAVSTDALEARDTARVIQPDAVVIDFALECQGVVGLLHQLKALDRSPFVIVLTNDPHLDCCRGCLGAADLILDKSGDTTVLLAVLEQRAAMVQRRDSEAPSAPGGSQP